jgi:nitrogen regulatory protein P-II 1
MKEIKAVIQPAKLEALRQAFRRIPDFPGMTVSRAQGSGYHPDKPRPAGIKAELTDYSEKVRIEIVARDEEAAALIEIIHKACHTGRPGDGVLWVTEVAQFKRLRIAPGGDA